MDSSKQKVYHPAIDMLRITAILAVICIHTTTRILQFTSNNLEQAQWTLFLNQSARFAVPLFFMISGFVLELNYPFHISYASYLKKRLTKIFVPYIFWSCIYFFLVYPQPLGNLPDALLEGNASYQLYFIPALLILYLVFPFIHRHYRFLAHKLSLSILGILQLGLLYYSYSIQPLPYFYPLQVVLFNFYIFLLGSIASHHQERIMTFLHKWKIFFILLSIAFAIFIFLEGKNNYLQTHNYLAFYSQWRPSILLYTICLGAVLYYFFNRRTTHFHFIKTLSQLSFLVFFVHVIILEFVWNTGGKFIFSSVQADVLQQMMFTPSYFLVSALLSFLAAFILHNIPLIKKIVG